MTRITLELDDETLAGIMIVAAMRLAVPLRYTADLDHGRTCGLVTAVKPFLPN